MLKLATVPQIQAKNKSRRPIRKRKINQVLENSRPAVATKAKGKCTDLGEEQQRTHEEDITKIRKKFSREVSKVCI
jgi:hypothetical protein